MRKDSRLGVGVPALTESGVTLSDGQSIESATVIWAGGFRASPLTAQVPAERDRSGRLMVDGNLRVAAVPTIFAALKGAIDRDRTAGRYILTGSANVLLVPKLSDSLAGRMHVLRLHPEFCVEVREISKQRCEATQA